jgi:chromosome segregation protein
MSATYQIGSLENNQKNNNINQKPYSTFVNKSKDQKISELRSKLDSLLQNSKDYDSLNNRYKQLLNDFSALNEAKLRLEYEIQQRESEYNRRIFDLKSENETLQLGLNTKITTSKKLFNENDIIEREIGIKTEEVKNLNEKLKDVSYQYDINCQNGKNLVNLAQNLNNDLISQNEQILKLKEDNISLTKICQENEKKLKRDENDLQILSNQLEENNYDLGNLNKKVSLQENILNDLNNKLNTSKENNISMQIKIKSLEKEFDTLRDENDNLKNDIIDERTLRINTDNDNNNLKNILLEKEAQLNLINNENENIKLINSQNGNNKEKNKIMNNKLKNQVILLESQNENLIKEIDNILEEHKKMKEIIKRKSRITSLLKSNNDNLEQSINDLDSFLNSKTIYQNQQISPRFTYIYEQK